MAMVVRPVRIHAIEHMNNQTNVAIITDVNVEDVEVLTNKGPFGRR